LLGAQKGIIKRRNEKVAIKAVLCCICLHSHYFFNIVYTKTHKYLPFIESKDLCLENRLPFVAESLPLVFKNFPSFLALPFFVMKKLSLPPTRTTIRNKDSAITQARNTGDLESNTFIAPSSTPEDSFSLSTV